MKYKLPLLSITFAIFLLVGIFLFVQAHEEVHIKIFKDYEIESHIEYFSHFPGVVTLTEPINSTQCPNECKLANNINDAVGYHLFIIYIMVGISFFLIILILEEKK